jgi:predicted ABC-type sugar transport system permease subunit
MGKRSRKRGDAVPAPAPARAATSTAARRRVGRPSLEDRPKPPWHPVPLVELCVLVGIVLLVLGALDLGSDRGKLMLVLGMALGSLGGLDTALREHLAGYRSHTTVIASLPAVTAAAATYFAGVAWPLVVVTAVAVFAVVFWLMRRTFMRRASRARRARG